MPISTTQVDDFMFHGDIKKTDQDVSHLSRRNKTAQRLTIEREKPRMIRLRAPRVSPKPAGRTTTQGQA